MKAKLLKRIIVSLLTLPIVGFVAIVLIGYIRQDTIVQNQIAILNTYYSGNITVGDTHLAPFANFPYMSIKIDDFMVQESKSDSAATILNVAHIYIGFNFWDIIAGNNDIQSLRLEDGFFDIVLHTDGSTNLQNALTSSAKNEDEAPIAIHLKNIALKNIDIHQREEATNMDIGTLIHWAKAGFNAGNDKIIAHVETEFELNVLRGSDSTYFKNKHFSLNTDFVFNETNGLLVFEPSRITMEHGDFELQGTIDTKKDMNLAIEVKGTKPSFDMFIAFAPTELIPVLERYKNAGDIYFNATLQGPITDGRQPFMEAKFDATEAYLENFAVNRKVDNMGFKGYFTNGKERSLQTMEFSLQDMTANLEKGKFIGNIHVKNFESPEIDMQVDADFDIPFITSFLNLSDVTDVKGNVEMKLKFHDIIDLENPLKSLNELNQAYYAKLKIDKLSFNSEALPAPLENLDVLLEMNGKQARLDTLNMVLGNSDIALSGLLSDLPAIIHHTTTPVTASLNIKSKVLDIATLTKYAENDSISQGMNERIENLSVALSYNALANAFTEYTHLPKGEFFINDLYADLKNYPHTLHDFKAAITVRDTDLSIKDFSGYIDDSDFHFNGSVYDYSSWMQDELNGDVDFDITLTSNLLKFEDLFSYNGNNYVPEEYRHEQIEGLALHLESTMHYKKNKLQNIKATLDRFDGTMKIHPLRFENFNGQFQYEKEHVMIKDFKGKMGRSDFDIDMNYYLGDDPFIKKKDNLFSLTSNYIDFDALSNYNAKEANPSNNDASLAETTEDVAAHAEAFNIYKIPFPDMQFVVDIKNFKYHTLDLKNMMGNLVTTPVHFINVNNFSFDTAGGTIALQGVFNGSDPDHIFLEPNLKLTNVDIDKLLFKFENMGKDISLSENLHGTLNTTITGNIRMYPDFIVDLDQSEIHLDAEVLNGSLENYEPVKMLSDFFGDKDLTNIRFDTLKNHMDIVNGTISIPNMTIESTLGHMDLSGTKNMNSEIDFYMRIPLKLIAKATKNKLFGSKERDPETEDQIIKRDTIKRVRYLNLNIKGTLDDYNIKMGRDKRKTKE